MARRVLGWIAAAAGVLALLAVLAGGLVNTDGGRAFLARQLVRVAPESGLRIAVGRIEGSIYGRATLRDLTFSDPQGVFVRVPEATLDWRPVQLIRKRVEIRELIAPEVEWLRLPRLNKTDRTGPILPDFDIHVGSLKLTRIDIGAAVTGRPQQATLTGSADIAAGRAQIDAEARTLGGSDRLVLKLDAEPDRDRFDIDARVNAPTAGVFAQMLGLKAPLKATIVGDGRWSAWAGRADALLGGKPLAALRVTGKDGTFRLTGTAMPGLMLGGAAQRLADPNVGIDATAKLGERRIDTRIALASPALRLLAAGGLDLGAGVYDGFKVDAQLLKPAALLRGADVRDATLAATVSGPLARPVVDFAVQTPRLAVATTVLERLRVTGRADLATKPLTVLVVATVARVTGLGPDLQSILTNVRVDGPITVAGLRLTSNALNLRSEKLTGRATLDFDLRTARYDIGILGSLARYLVPGVGLVDVKTDLHAVPDSAGRLHLTGKATAVVQRLDNGLFRSLMEGLPTITTDLDLPPGGSVLFRNLRLTSPALRLNGDGERTRDGVFRIAAAGSSTRYGPVVVRIDGPLPTPKVDLVLARPGFGIGLAGVKAQLLPAADGWTFTAAGATNYGPASARGRIVSRANQPTVIELADLNILGITARGALRNMPAGFVGTLAVTGNGVTGALRFAPAGVVQRIDADLAFERARLPLTPPVSVTKGSLTATVLMNPGAPSVRGKLVATGIRRGPLTLTSTDLDIDYANGRGTATGKVSGRQGSPFALTGGIAFAPDTLTVTAAGTIDKQTVRLATPAVLTRVTGGWRLAPAKLDLSGGSATIGGTFGDTTAIDADLKGLGLGLLDLAYPGLGLGGTVSGTVNVVLPADGSLPRGRVNLRVQRFTRAGVGTISAPVDIGLNGAIEANEAAAKAVVVRGGAVIGRAQAQLRPIPGRADDRWVERLLAAPLVAQLRFNGPADALWPLLNIRVFDIRGPVAVAADFGGHLGEPTITGRMTSTGLRFESAVLGTIVDSIQLDSRFNGSRLEFRSIRGNAGKGGTITGSGRIDLSLERGFPIDMKFDAVNALALRRDDLRATVTGPIRITSNADGGLIKGDLRIDKAQFRIGRPQLETVPDLPFRERGAGIDDAAPARKPTIWRLDLAADADNKVAVTGLGLDSEWSAKVKIGGQADAPRITGGADLVRGGYEFAGKRFDLTRGRLRFTGAYPPDPTVDIVAAANVSGVTATISISGTSLAPEIAFSSIPALPEDEVLSRVLFGSSITNLSAPEALQLAGAVASLRGGGNSNFDVMRAVRKGLGIDRLRVLPGDTTTGRGTAVAAGEYIGDKVYVEVASDAQGYTATQIEYSITRWLSVLGQIATVGGNSVNLKVSKDY